VAAANLSDTVRTFGHPRFAQSREALESDLGHLQGGGVGHVPKLPTSAEISGSRAENTGVECRVVACRKAMSSGTCIAIAETFASRSSTITQ